MGRLFGTDGVRGIAGTELDCTLAANLAKAAAMILEEKMGKRPKFIIGRDTRISGQMLEAAVSSGLCSAGADVVLLGVLPTPAVAYLVGQLGADAGIMLSASHNSYEYNGIKIFGADGFKLTDDEEFEIEEIVLDKKMPYTERWGAQLGRVSTEYGAVDRYIDHITGAVQGSLAGLRIAVDCANGSASATARQVFDRLGAQAEIRNASPDGLNINHNCGSTHLGELCAMMRSGSFDLGIAYDGDADRCLAVDECGNEISGDRIIAMLAKHLKDQGNLKNDAVAVTVMSNFGFFKFAQDNGIKAETTRVGDRYVLERMLERNISIGGEQSGHIIFRDYMTTGDGQLSSIKLLELIRDAARPASELAQVMEEFPQVLVGVRADATMKARWELDEGVRLCMERGNARLAGSGRILVRASGTEPLIRVMVEGSDQVMIEEIAQEIAQTIRDRLEQK